MRGASGPAEMRRRLGALALATETVDEPTRLTAIRARLPRAEWPERPIVLPAVDAETDLDAELAALAPAEALVIWADEASVAAFGSNPLSPETRGPAARAGRAVGRDRAPAVAEFWR